MTTVDVLVQGYPGRATHHGGLGWSTVALVRTGSRNILVDVGAFGARKLILKALVDRGVQPTDVTDVVLTHAHYDHAVNFTLFPSAAVWIGDEELNWAAAQPPGFNPLPELYIRELCTSPRVRRVRDGETFLPGLQAVAAPGHTPGHLLFYLSDTDEPVLFTGDAAKNRAELLSMSVADTGDEQASARTLERIWQLWKQRPGTLLVPGHDLSMRLDPEGRPVYVGERTAEICAWFSETMQQTKIDLCCTPRLDFSRLANE